jgi:hypothetical protein
MAVRFVRSSIAEKEIKSVGPKVPRVDPALVAGALGATRSGGRDGMNLAELAEAMRRLMSSTGGRPGLVGAEGQAKIPKIAADWAKLEKAARLIGEAGPHQPSTTQIAALLLHYTIEQRSPADLLRIIGEAAKREPELDE